MTVPGTRGRERSADLSANPGGDSLQTTMESSKFNVRKTLLEEIMFEPYVKEKNQSEGKEANKSLRENYQKTSSPDPKRKEHKTKMKSNIKNKLRYKQYRLTKYVEIIEFLSPDTYTKRKEYKKKLKQTLPFTLEIPNMKPNTQNEKAKSEEKQKGYKETNSSLGHALRKGIGEENGNKNITNENEKEGGADKQSTMGKSDKSRSQHSPSIIFRKGTQNTGDSKKQMPQKNSMAETSQNHMRKHTTETADDRLPPKLDPTTETIKINEEKDDIIAQTNERIKEVEELISKARISLSMDSEKISRELEELQNETKAIEGDIIWMNRTMMKQASQLSRVVVKWTCNELAKQATIGEANRAKNQKNEDKIKQPPGQRRPPNSL